MLFAYLCVCMLVSDWETSSARVWISAMALDEEDPAPSTASRIGWRERASLRQAPSGTETIP